MYLIWWTRDTFRKVTNNFIWLRFQINSIFSCFSKIFQIIVMASTKFNCLEITVDWFNIWTSIQKHIIMTININAAVSIILATVEVYRREKGMHANNNTIWQKNVYFSHRFAWYCLSQLWAMQHPIHPYFLHFWLFLKYSGNLQGPQSSLQFCFLEMQWLHQYFLSISLHCYCNPLCYLKLNDM